MKYLFIKHIIMLLFLMPNLVVANDINGDSKVGVTDAITALQVASGVQTQIYLPTGLQWKGKWCSSNIKYNMNDMVEHEGSSYICILSHISNDNILPMNDEYWQVVAQGGQSSIDKINTISMIAGETLSGAENPVPVYLSKDGLIIQQTESNSDEIIFGVNKFAQTFTTDLDTSLITRISIDLEKMGVPEGDVIVALHTIDQNNIPENLCLKQSIASASSIQNGWNNFYFNTSVVPLSTYVIIVCVPNGDSSNYIKWKKKSSNIYPEGKILNSTNFGFDWSELNSSDFCFKIFSNNRVYACRANSLEKIDFIGFALTNANSGENVIVQINGIVKGFDRLQVGHKYYIQDNSGIDVAIGSYKKLIGIALNEKDVSIFWADSMEFATLEDALNGLNDYKIMTSNIVMKTLQEQINPLKYYIRTLIPSDTLRASANTEKYANRGEWKITKSITVNLFGRIRVKFKFKANSDTDYLRVQRYINNQQLGDIITTTSLEYVDYSYETSVEEGTIISLKTLGRGCVKDFGLYWDVKMIQPYRINID